MRAFCHRNYRLFFGGQAISLVGTWMQQVAQAWLVLQLTGDALWLGVVAAAQFLPVLSSACSPASSPTPCRSAGPCWHPGQQDVPVDRSSR